MNKRVTIIALGFLVALMPFLGFPGSAKTVFFVLAGLLLAVLGYVLEAECEKCIVEEKKKEEDAKKQDDQETPASVGGSVMDNNT